MNNLQVTDQNDILAHVTAAAAAGPSSGVSPKYSFFSTSEIVKSLSDQGFFISRGGQSRSNGNSGFQKHWLYFRHDSLKSFVVSGSTWVPEITITNSHDGTHALRIHAGLNATNSGSFVMPAGRFGGSRLVHRGLTMEMVHMVVNAIIHGQAEMAAAAVEMSATILTAQQLKEMTAKCLEARDQNWEEKLSVDSVVSQVFRESYTAEGGSVSLWAATTGLYNALLRGGLIGLPQTSRVFRSRAIRSQNRTVRLSQDIWTIAESYKA